MEKKVEQKPGKKKLRPERIPLNERAPDERVRDFREVPLGYTEHQAKDEAGRCLNCKNRPCKSGCPVGIDCGGFVVGGEAAIKELGRGIYRAKGILINRQIRARSMYHAAQIACGEAEETPEPKPATETDQD